jgi:hypothetical protein
MEKLKIEEEMRINKILTINSKYLSILSFNIFTFTKYNTILHFTFIILTTVFKMPIVLIRFILNLAFLASYFCFYFLIGFIPFY